MSLKIVFILTNSADPDEMPYAAFHLGLHFLPKYLFNGIQNVKGNKVVLYHCTFVPTSILLVNVFHFQSLPFISCLL